MRILFFSLCLCILVSGCKKNSDNAVCHLNQIQVFGNGTLSYSSNYEYDSNGRIKKIITGVATSTYDYFTGSIVVTMTQSTSADYSRTTYYLNNAGLATSSKTIFIPNPNFFQFDYTYTYDAEGYLTAERWIFSQVYNGNILRDTDYANYTVINGNITKRTATDSHEAYFEYSSEALPDNIPVLNIFPSREGAFLGKSPRNLLSKEKDTSGNTLGTYSYTFGINGRKVIDMTVTSSGGSSKTQLHYICN